MKFNVTFVEKVTKIVTIEADSLEKVNEIARDYLDDPAKNIDFEKNFDEYDTYIERIKRIYES